jgi:hypothetical protein
MPFSFEGATDGFGATDFDAPFNEPDGLLTAARTGAGAGDCELREASLGLAGFSEGFAGPNELFAARGSGA